MIKNKKFILYLFLLFSLSIIFSSCSRPLLDSQIHFGIKAAQKDLWEEAIFRWKKVLLSNPESASAHNNLAVAYEKKGLWEEAEKEYEAALKYNPGNKYIKANFENFKKNYELLKKETKDEKN